MALIPPRIVGPLSECSDHVIVRGQVSGAQVEVYAGGDVVASGSASGGSDLFSLTRSLAAGEVVTARQTVGTTSSSPTPRPQAVEVQAEPSEIGPVTFRTKLFECGECLFVGGMVPGASLEVRADGSTLGTASTYDGDTRVGLSRPLQPGDDVVGQQEACGRDGAETDAPSVQHPVGDSDVQGRVLPPPDVETPLQECERAITFGGLYPGAELSVTRSGGPDFSFCAFTSRIQVWISPPLSQGESVTARQEFTNCELFGRNSDPVVVGPADDIVRPGVEAPLCENGTAVTLTGLEGGATFRITVVPPGAGGVGAATTYRGEAPEDGTFVAPIDPLPAGATVTAVQELCSRTSGESDPIVVEEAPADLETPVVAEPLFECADIVHVSNLHPGTRLKVYSADLGAPISEKQVYDDEADVRVAPLLSAGDEIYAVAFGCGHESDRSVPVEVQEFEDLDPPRVIPPVYDCDETITVREVVPGAQVDVYVDGAWRGRTTASETRAEVPVEVGELEPDDEVQARQQLCGRQTELSQAVEVKHFEGEWDQIGDEEKAEILAIHAALLPTGEILYFGGDQHHADEVGGDIDNTRLYDVETGEITEVTGLPVDLFCSGHALLEDGSLIAAGGTTGWVQPEGHHHEGHFLGSRASYRYDHTDADWHQAGQLNTQRPSQVPAGTDLTETGGRWYPTLVTLADGRVLALGGHPLGQDTRHTNTSLELYDPDAQSWNLVGNTDYNNIPGAAQAMHRGQHSEYPRLHVLPDDGSTVLSTSTMTDDTIEEWHPYADPTNWTQVVSRGPGSFYEGNPINYSAVLLPLRHDEDYRPRVFLCGGSTPYLLDLGASSSSWTPVSRTMSGHPDPGDVNPERTYVNATLLPTGTVFMNGGAKDPRDDSTGVLQPEVYDQRAGSWDVLPAADVVRNYHSVSLLQPDGAVWTAGSNHDADAGGPEVREYRIEEFRPWYFCEDRPVVADAPDRVCHGDAFEIRTGDTRPISEVAIVRCGSVTHSFNPDQRYVTLAFERSGDHIETQIPHSAAVAVPGYYLLFVLDENGVPSEGRYTQVCQSVDSGLGDLGDWRDELKRILERTCIRPRDRRDLIDDLDEYLRAEVDELSMSGRRPRRGGELTVSELHVDAEADDYESLTDEYVTFTNVGSDALDLAGWSVADQAGHVYVFPTGFELRPDEIVRLRTGLGTDTDRDLYWGSESPVWNNRSDTISVYDDDQFEVLRNPYGQ
jgi:hypothetical protein